MVIETAQPRLHKLEAGGFEKSAYLTEGIKNKDFRS